MGSSANSAGLVDDHSANVFAGAALRAVGARFLLVLCTKLLASLKLLLDHALLGVLGWLVASVRLTGRALPWWLPL